MEKENKRLIIFLIITIILFGLLFILGLVVGRYNISITNFIKALFTSSEEYITERRIIYNLRLPRTIVAGLSGIALSLSGLIYQETFQNKLVSPDLLGVSSGAGVGAALAILLGLSSAFVSVFAFAFGLATVTLTLIIAKAFRNKTDIMLVLAGIVVGGLASSILSLIKYLADAETILASITYWLMGSFDDVTMKSVWIMLPIVIICALLLLLISHRINIIALGKEEAITKGVNYNAYRIIIIMVSTLLTAITVSFCGTISWIGLVIPHIVRLIVGKNTTRSIPLCITFGGCFMIIVDILSRVFTTSEIPLSAITGLFGTIIFIIILISRRRKLYEH